MVTSVEQLELVLRRPAAPLAAHIPMAHQRQGPARRAIGLKQCLSADFGRSVHAGACGRHRAEQNTNAYRKSSPHRDTSPLLKSGPTPVNSSVGPVNYFQSGSMQHEHVIGSQAQEPQPLTNHGYRAGRRRSVRPTACHQFQQADCRWRHSHQD